jgi:hypothetical protein
MGHIPTESRHFLDNGTAEETVMGSGGQEKGFQVGGQSLVGVGQLEFEFKIAQGPQAPEDHTSARISCHINGEAIKTPHLNALKVARGLTDLMKALLEGERGSFAGVLQHGHHKTVEQHDTSFNEVQMAQSEGIKTAGVKGPHGTGRLEPF